MGRRANGTHRTGWGQLNSHWPGLLHAKPSLPHPHGRTNSRARSCVVQNSQHANTCLIRHSSLRRRPVSRGPGPRRRLSFDLLSTNRNARPSPPGGRKTHRRSAIGRLKDPIRRFSTPNCDFRPDIRHPNPIAPKLQSQACQKLTRSLGRRNLGSDLAL